MKKIMTLLTLCIFVMGLSVSFADAPSRPFPHQSGEWEQHNEDNHKEPHHRNPPPKKHHHKKHNEKPANRGHQSPIVTPQW